MNLNLELSGKELFWLLFQIKKQIKSLGLLTPKVDIPAKERRSVEYKYQIGDVEHEFLAKLVKSYNTDTDGISLWRIINDFRGIDESSLNLAATTLERLGPINKRIAIDHHYNNEEYFAFSVTANGVDYLLESEQLLLKKTQTPPQQYAPKQFGNF